MGVTNYFLSGMILQVVESEYRRSSTLELPCSLIRRSFLRRANCRSFKGGIQRGGFQGEERWQVSPCQKYLEDGLPVDVSSE